MLQRHAAREGTARQAAPGAPKGERGLGGNPLLSPSLVGAAFVRAAGDGHLARAAPDELWPSGPNRVERAAIPFSHGSSRDAPGGEPRACCSNAYVEKRE